MKPVQFFLSPQVRLVVQNLLPNQREQFQRLLLALQIAPIAGPVYAHDNDARLLRIASAADAHVIYSVIYRVHSDHIFITDLVIAEWNPTDVDMV
jgi:hypothetical protein